RASLSTDHGSSRLSCSEACRGGRVRPPRDGGAVPEGRPGLRSFGGGGAGGSGKAVGPSTSSAAASAGRFSTSTGDGSWPGTRFHGGGASAAGPGIGTAAVLCRATGWVI